MGKLSSLFESFDNLDQIDVNSLIPLLHPPPQRVQLENYLANLILYPQALPLTEYEMKINLAVLREALSLNGPMIERENNLLGSNPFINVTLRKILIPESFLSFVPDLVSLTEVFIDAFLRSHRKEDFFWDLWTVVLTDDSDEIVGSVILPQFANKDGEMDITVLGKSYKIVSGKLSIIPCMKERCEISYKLKQGQVLGKSESALQLYGGKMGILIDGRVE